MYLKVLVCLLIVGYCASVWTGSKNISINDDESVIEITTGDGRRINIVKNRPGLDKRKTIDISVSGPNMRTKTVRIDDDKGYSESYDELYGRMKRSSKYSSKYSKQSQGDILTELCSEFRGVNDEKSYEKFIKKLEKYTEKGELDPSILDLIRELDREDSLQRRILGLEDTPDFNSRRSLLQRVLCGIREGGCDDARSLVDPLQRYQIYPQRLGVGLEESAELERQARINRLIREDIQTRDLLGKEREDQLIRLPLTRGQYIPGSLAGIRDYQLREDSSLHPSRLIGYQLRSELADDPLRRLQLLREQSDVRNQLLNTRGDRLRPELVDDSLRRFELLREESDVRNRLLSAREDPLFWNRIAARQYSFPNLNQRGNILSNPGLEDLLRRERLEDSVRFQIYGRPSPYELPAERTGLASDFALRRRYPFGLYSDYYLQRRPSERFGPFERPFLSRQLSSIDDYQQRVPSERFGLLQRPLLAGEVPPVLGPLTLQRPALIY